MIKEAHDGRERKPYGKSRSFCLEKYKMNAVHSFLTSPMVGGAAIWWLAGIVAFFVSSEKLNDAVTSDPAAGIGQLWWLIVKVALPWTICGFLAGLFILARVRVAFSRLTVIRNANPVLSSACVGVMFAVFLGLVAGLALAHWQFTNIELPPGFCLKPGRTRYAAAIVAASVAGILTVPSAVACMVKSINER